MHGEIPISGPLSHEPEDLDPYLFISGTLDVRTPPSNAEEVRKGFSNSVHLIVDGAVHSDPLFLSSPKIKEVMLEFMRGEKLSTTTITLPPLELAEGEAMTLKTTPFIDLSFRNEDSLRTRSRKSAPRLISSLLIPCPIGSAIIPSVDLSRPGIYFPIG